jgi:hypothetical protein
VLLSSTCAWQDAQAVSDEIQVYTDDINAPGERGLELHVNATPKGRRNADYEGELPPHHGLRITPEFSWGLTRTLEAGLYIPMATSAEGNAYLGGFKGRLKWLPVYGDGWYAGANVEVSNNTRKFSESHIASELRVMLGYHAADWLIGINPIFEWGLTPGYRGSPEFEMAYKAVRQVTHGVSLGMEYYNGLGRLNQRLPSIEQDKTLYMVMDYEGDPLAFNLGIGRGMNDISDRWTVKAIFEIPFK